jgi:hypothetical protein
MRARLQAIIVAIAASGPAYAVVLAVALGSFVALNRIAAGFPPLAGGALPFDLQNGLAVADVYAQLAGWSPGARTRYYAFSAVDWLFPLAAGLFLAATVAFCLRRSLPRAWSWVTRRQLLPLLLLGTACDWLENVFALLAVGLYPQESPLLAVGLVVAKRAKLAALFPSQGLMLGLLAWTAAQALLRRRAPPRAPPAPPPAT